MAKKKTGAPSKDKAFLFDYATIRGLKMTPKTADSGYALRTTLSVESIYSEELEAQLLNSEEHDLVFNASGAVRSGFTSTCLSSSLPSASVDLYEPKEVRKAGDKPLLTLSPVQIDSFVVSDHAGTPHISFKITLDGQHDKIAAFVAKRKVFVGILEVFPLQQEMELESFSANDDEDSPMLGEFDIEDTLDGEGEEIPMKVKKPKKAPAKKAPAKKSKS